MKDNSQIHGEVTTAVYDIDESDGWNELSDKEKLHSLKQREPEETYTTENITLRGMHIYFAQNLDDTQSVNESASYLAVGNDNTGPSVDNTTLNNEVFRKSVTDYTQTDNEVTTSTFIDTDEANDYTFREVGLFSGQLETDIMWNHAIINDVAKDISRTITIDVTLTFDRA